MGATTRMMRAGALLVLLAFAAAPAAARSLTVAEALVTTDSLASEQEQCQEDSYVAGSFALTEAQCKTCVENTIGAPSLAGGWVCRADLCQKKEFFQYDTPATAEEQCVDCVLNYPALDCLSCFQNVPLPYTAIGAPSEPEGDLTSLDPTDVRDARQWCLQCQNGELTGYDSWGYTGVPGWKDAGGQQDFRWACSVCANLPPGPERDWCVRCISSTDAQYAPYGILSVHEEVRPNNFGKCADFANMTYWSARGVFNTNGLLAQCARTTETFAEDDRFDLTYPEMTPYECALCTFTTLNTTLQPENTTKGFACYEYCRNPDYAPGILDGSEVNGVPSQELVDGCTTCVGDPNVYDAWGCGNCMELNADAEGYFNVTECFTCVTDNQYKFVVGSYNWACGECAAIEDYDVRQLCFNCIQSPAVTAGAALDDLLKDHAWVGDANELVCTCVDMAKSTWGGDFSDGFDPEWYTASCDNCTAMQKTCYKRRNITLSHTPIGGEIKVVRVDGPAGARPLPQGYRYIRCEDVADDSELADAAAGANCSLVGGYYDGTGNTSTCSEGDDVLWCALATNAPGWHLIHIDDYLPNDSFDSFGESCAECITDFNTAGKGSAAWTCDKVCMDPYLIHSVDQYEQCDECLKDFRAGDIKEVASCEFCLQTLNFFEDQADNLAARGLCIDCISKPTNWPDNRDWACTECAKIANPAAKDLCYECLAKEGGVIDPCQCVDGAKRGWLFYEWYSCVSEEVIVELLKNETEHLVPGLIGGTAEVNVTTREECAFWANQHGTNIFGLSTPVAGGDSVCYFFQGNTEYFDHLAITAGTCDTNCSIVTYDDGYYCGGAGSVELFEVTPPTIV